MRNVLLLRRVERRIARLLPAMVLILLSLPASAVEPAVIASKGNGSVAACASCHGAEGGGMATFPRLAGMNATYLEKQLADFIDGSRSSPVMEPIAKGLTPAERTAMAAYYAQLPVPATPSPAAATEGGAGARIARYGKWSENVPGCMQCHGPGGRGVGEHFPAIAAQPAEYISAQIKAFRDGSRKNDPLELMRHLSDGLTDEEIAAVATWFAGQPALASRAADAGGAP